MTPEEEARFRALCAEHDMSPELVEELKNFVCDLADAAFSRGQQNVWENQ